MAAKRVACRELSQVHDPSQISFNVLNRFSRAARYPGRP